jgi:hypothetical protein
MERTTSFVEQEELQKKEVLKAPFTLNIPNKEKLTSHSTYTERALIPPPLFLEKEDNKELIDAQIRDKGELEEEVDLHVLIEVNPVSHIG